MNPSEILDQAAAQIERVGWMWRSWYDYDGPELDPVWTDCSVCAGGGINVAAGYAPDHEDHDDIAEPVTRAFEALARRVNRTLIADDDVAEFIEVVKSWNDADERTAKEVVAELRAAAATEREAGR